MAGARTTTNPATIQADDKHHVLDQFNKAAAVFDNPDIDLTTLLQQCEQIIGTPENYCNRIWGKLEPLLTRRYRKKIQEIFNKDLSPEGKITLLQALVPYQSIADEIIKSHVCPAINKAYFQAAFHAFNHVLHDKETSLENKINLLIKLKDDLGIIFSSSDLPIAKHNLHYNLSFKLFELFSSYIQKICLKKWNHLLFRQDLDFSSKLAEMQALKTQTRSYLARFSNDEWVLPSSELPEKVNELISLEPLPSSNLIVEIYRKFYAMKPFLSHLFDLFMSTQFDVSIQGEMVPVVTESKPDIEMKKAQNTDSIKQEKLSLEKHAIIFQAWLTKGSGAPYQDEVKSFIEDLVAAKKAGEIDIKALRKAHDQGAYNLIKFLTSHPKLQNFFYNVFMRYSNLEAASVAYNTGHVINAHLLLKSILLPNFKGCALFLMSPPKNGHYKPTDQRHLFLYKDEKGLFYYFPDKITRQDISFPKHSVKTGELLSNDKFNQPEEKPHPCDNKEICQVVLNLTAKKNHTHRDSSYEEFYAVEEWLNNTGKAYQETIKKFGKAIEEKLSAEEMRQYQQALLPPLKKPGLFTDYVETDLLRSELFSTFLVDHPDILDFFVKTLRDPLIAQTGIAYLDAKPSFEGDIQIITSSVMSMYPLAQKQVGEVFFWEEMDKNDVLVWKAAHIEIDNGQKKLSQVIVPPGSAFFQALNHGSAEERVVQMANEGASIAVMTSDNSRESFVAGRCFELINKLRFLFQSEEKDFLFGKKCGLFLLSGHPLPSQSARAASDAAFFSSKPSKQKVIDQANCNLGGMWVRGR